MESDLKTIKGIGDAVAGQLIAAGITSTKQLREMGAHAAYGRMMENGIRPHFIGYYALEMALQGRPWNDCKGAEKDRLKERFDELKSSIQSDGALIHELRAIGVMI